MKLKYLLPLIVLFTLISSCKKNIEGCTELGASNYDVDANIDDGSCIYSGCTNSMSDNYDSTATEDDGSCIPWSDKFVGLYDANLECSLLVFLSNEFQMNINRVSDNKVTMNMNLSQAGSFPISATIDGDDMTLDQFELNGLDLEIPIGPLTVVVNGIKINGSFIYNNDTNTLDGNMIFSFNTSLGEQADTCPITAVKI